MNWYQCPIDQYIYKPEEHGMVPFESLADDWMCPNDGTSKFSFYELLIISGTIFPASTENVSGVSITLTPAGQSVIDTDSGYYAIALTSIPYTGIISASKSNFVFTPLTYNLNNLTISTGSYNFRATYVPPATPYYSISGSVFLSGTSIPMKNLRIKVQQIIGQQGHGVSPTYIYTDNDGHFSSSLLQGGLSYYLQPTHAIYSMLPETMSYYNLSSSINEQVFSSSLITWSISGNIQSSSGAPVAYILIKDSLGNMLLTNSSGYYSMNYTQSTDVVLTPSSSDYVFYPGIKEYINLTASKSDQNYTAYQTVPSSTGLGNYYDSRKQFDPSTNTWYNIVSNSDDLTTYNTSYPSSKDLLFGASYLGNSSASFIGTKISASFAMEFLIAPFTSSVAETIVSTISNNYPSILAYITGSEFVVSYKATFNLPEIIVKSYNISRNKYNHVVFFTSQSYLSVWSNGICYESASISASSWSGGILGINSKFNNNPHRGFLNVFKIWNGININLSDINKFYEKRNYWSSLTHATEPAASAVVPTTYPNLIVWYQPSGLTGNPQTGWNDSSGNGYNLSGGAGYSPLTINGINVYNCNNGLSRNVGNDFIGTSYTLIMVANNGLSTGNYMFRTVDSNTGAFMELPINFGSPSKVSLYCSDIHSALVYPIPTYTTYNTGTYILVCTLDSITGTLTCYTQDGTSWTKTESGWDKTTSFAGTLTLGEKDENPAAIGTFIAYKDVKTPDVINALCQELATKYGISWTDISASPPEIDNSFVTSDGQLFIDNDNSVFIVN